MIVSLTTLCLLSVNLHVHSYDCMELEYILSYFPIIFFIQLHCIIMSVIYLMYHIKANFKPPKEIRGGIPICFPQVCAKLFFFFIQLISFTFVMESASYLQFSDFGSLEKHGFARNRTWSIDTNPLPSTTNSPSWVAIDLILKPSKKDLKIFPHRYISKCCNGLSLHGVCLLECYIYSIFRFEFRLIVTLGLEGELMLTSRITNANSDQKPFKFTFAYHTYFSILDIRYGSAVT